MRRRPARLWEYRNRGLRWAWSCSPERERSCRINGILRRNKQIRRSGTVTCPIIAGYEHGGFAQCCPPGFKGLKEQNPA